MSEVVLGARLGKLVRAVREHIAEMDGIMKGPSTYERGQQVARSIGKLEAALRDCESRFTASPATGASQSPPPTGKSSSTAGSTRRPKRPNKH